MAKSKRSTDEQAPDAAESRVKSQSTVIEYWQIKKRRLPMIVSLIALVCWLAFLSVIAWLVAF